MSRTRSTGSPASSWTGPGSPQHERRSGTFFGYVVGTDGVHTGLELEEGRSLLTDLVRQLLHTDDPSRFVMEITSDADIVLARADGRALAAELGFSRTDATLVATVISEIARNIVVHAGRGEIELKAEYQLERRGVAVIATDQGPGIGDVDAAMREGFGTKDGLGLGLPGVRRIVDDFAIETAPDRGTTVTMHLWRDLRELDLTRQRTKTA